MEEVTSVMVRVIAVILDMADNTCTFGHILFIICRDVDGVEM